MGPRLDVSYLSDEFTGGFTGTFIGIAAIDALHKKSYADFRDFTVSTRHDSSGSDRD